jgi:hypothetical protein
VVRTEVLANCLYDLDVTLVQSVRAILLELARVAFEPTAVLAFISGPVVTRLQIQLALRDGRGLFIGGLLFFKVYSRT